jgi:hypothetical protein
MLVDLAISSMFDKTLGNLLGKDGGGARVNAE